MIFYWFKESIQVTIHEWVLFPTFSWKLFFIPDPKPEGPKPFRTINYDDHYKKIRDLDGPRQRTSDAISNRGSI